MTASRQRYLAAMGIPVWVLRDGARGGVEHVTGESSLLAGDSDRVAGDSVLAAAESRLAAADSGLAAGGSGIAAGDPGLAASDSGGAEFAAAATRRDRGREAAPTVAGGTADAWQVLAAEVRGCTSCALHATRTQTVFGVGRRDADLLVIGEAPGADEDRQGEPFVGRAGQLLNAMLKAIGLDRAECYIANILKCRPPGNRDPKPEEAATCTPFLERQIALIEPRAILAVGRISAQWLLQTDEPIGRLRGRAHTYGKRGIPLVVTYHPAYLLRTPVAKAKSWKDLCLVRELIASSR